MSTSNRFALREVVSMIARADYELGCAAAEAKRNSAPTIGMTCDKLMEDCIQLREGILQQIGDES